MSPHSCLSHGRSIIATPTSSDSNCQSSEMHNITHSLVFSSSIPTSSLSLNITSTNVSCLITANKRQGNFLTSLSSSHYVLPSQTNNALHSPGDYLKPGEDEIDGLKRRLDERLAPPSLNQFDQVTHGINNDWEIGDCLAQWWRPNFETFMVSNVIRIPFF